MSVRVIQSILNHSQSEGGARLVMIALADRADDTGLCWPSVMDIARRSRLSRGQVFRHLKSLEEMGELKRVKAGGGGSTNTYQIEVDPSRRRDGGGSAHATGTRSAGATGGVAPARPEPSLNRHTPVEDCAQHPVYGDGGGVLVPPAPAIGTGRSAKSPTGSGPASSRRFTARQTESVDAFIERLASIYPRLGTPEERPAWASVGYRLCGIEREAANKIAGQLCEAAGKLAERKGPPAMLQRLANRLIGGVA